MQWRSGGAVEGGQHTCDPALLLLLRAAVAPPPDCSGLRTALVEREDFAAGTR